MRNNKYSCMLCDIYERGDALSEYYSPYSMWKLAKIKDKMVRVDLACALVYDNKSQTALDILCKLSKDKDPLVRVNAIDSLSEFPNEKSFNAMKHALTDGDNLVRKYAAFGVAWIGKELCPEVAKKILLEYENKEYNAHGKVSIYEGLYILGEKENLIRLIGMFRINDYQIQCSVLNALSEIVDNENRCEIQGFIETIDREQYPKSVLSSLERLESTIQDIVSGEIQA